MCAKHKHSGGHSCLYATHRHSGGHLRKSLHLHLIMWRCSEFGNLLHLHLLMKSSMAFISARRVVVLPSSMAVLTPLAAAFFLPTNSICAPGNCGIWESVVGWFFACPLYRYNATRYTSITQTLYRYNASRYTGITQTLYRHNASRYTGITMSEINS